MRRLTGILLAVVLGFGCTTKKETAVEGEGGSAWPTGIATFFQPEDRTVKHDKKLKVWVENKTGEQFSFEWSGEGTCGELRWDKAKNSEAVFVGGKLAKDCNEKLTLKVMGAEGTFNKQFGVKVEGSEQFATIEVRPDPIPDTWDMINDYDKTMKGKEVKCVTKVGGKVKKSMGLDVDLSKKREKSAAEKGQEKAAREAGAEAEIIDYFDDVQMNLHDAPFGPWKFESATCFFDESYDGEEGVLAYKYDLPHHEDYCGYYENLSVGEDCETTPFDTRPYEYATFIAKSGDEKTHRFYLELINWERFAEFHQGRPEAVGPFDATGEWNRYEINLADAYKDTLDPAGIKSLSIKITREANFPDSGLILFDNFAFIKKEGSN
jgi:hypothetical protein